MSETWNDLAALQNESVKPSYTDKNLIIIDGNNVGYRFLRRKNFSAFQDEYIRTIQSLAKSYQCKDVVVTFDYGKSAFRKAMFPDYKGNRDVPKTDEDKLHYEKFFAELNKTAENLPFTTFKIFGVEADDIISYLTTSLYNRYPHIWVVSSDRDIYQLLHPCVSIFNLFSKKEITYKSLWEEKGLDPAQYRLSRIIQGDSGDNIAGIEGIGEKRSQDLAKTYTVRDTNHPQSNLKDFDYFLSKLPLPGKSQYIRNLNAGEQLLRRNERLINLVDYTRETIGEKNLTELDKFVEDIKETSPILKIPDIHIKLEPSVSVKVLKTLVEHPIDI